MVVVVVVVVSLLFEALVGLSDEEVVQDTGLCRGENEGSSGRVGNLEGGPRGGGEGAGVLGGGERFAGEGWFGAVEVGGVADAIEEEGVFFGADALTEGQERQLLGVGLVGDPALDGETGRDGTHRGLVGAGKVYGEGGGVGRRRCGGRGGGGGDRRAPPAPPASLPRGLRSFPAWRVGREEWGVEDRDGMLLRRRK